MSNRYPDRSFAIAFESWMSQWLIGLMLLGCAATSSLAQASARGNGTVSGRVTEATTGLPVASTAVLVEGSSVGTTTDSLGNYRLANVPPGPQVIRAQRIGYSPTRANRVVPLGGAIVLNLEMARHALELKGVEVTADPTSRARGELGTATVIEQEAIRNQMAASLAGVLELVPGAVLQPPGLDNVRQISLRAVPVSSGSGGGDRSAETLASFGTLIILDGVPLSNNANLQTLGSRAELNFSSSAGGGIDLRRIPASTLERVEVIRGIPSARYGDLTQGAIIVDTRAGAVPAAATVRADERTTEASFVAGKQINSRNAAALATNAARTSVSQVSADSKSTRVSGQVSHRAILGGGQGTSPSVMELASSARLVLDTKLDFYELVDDRPEQLTIPGMSSRSRDAGARLSERARLRLQDNLGVEVTSALEMQRQTSFARANMLRSATPITNCTVPCRKIGRFVGGRYNARADVDGDPSMFYARIELTKPADVFGFSHDWRFGTELRREGNSGNGYQFDIEFPPQTQFNGVRGFARPRTFASIPALATTGLYVDDRLSRSLGAMLLNAQLGLRADILHEGGGWFSGSRDAVIQPRMNVELAPTEWFRLRGGVGRVAKAPTLADLHPAPQYYDVINVNFFANDPAERLAVLTTYLFDPANPALGYSISDKAEGGFEMRIGSSGASLGVTAFHDRIRGATGISPEATFLVREHFSLTNTVPGSGRPPVVVEPAVSVDSVPVLIDRPANNTSQRSNGLEMTATLPEISALKTRLEFQGAWVKSRIFQDAIEFSGSFDSFQISENQARSPYFDPIVRTGERMLLTTRIIHHQPAAGLVITGTIQHTLREARRNLGATDTLSFVGYITRGGGLVAVPLADRTRPDLTDVRLSRPGIFLTEQRTGADWIFSFQARKSLPLDGTLSFYAFNAFDKAGTFGSLTLAQRLYSPTRFGLELTMPLEGLFHWR